MEEEPKKTTKPKENFQEIYSKCRKLGISAKLLAELPAVKALKRRNDRVQITNAISTIFLVWSVVLLFGNEFSNPLTNFQNFLKNVNSGKCLLRMPNFAKYLLIQPFDCNICRNLQSVEKLSHISPKEFEEKFAYTGVPVVIKDGTKHWNATSVFSFEFFKEIYQNKDFKNTSAFCPFFRYQTEFRSLNDLWNMSSERFNGTWYNGWGNCDYHAASTLRQHYEKPYFLPPYSESVTMDWIFLGTPGEGAPLHVDSVYYTAWQAQIKGRKIWTLESSPECYDECKTLEVLVEPGEIIVVDGDRWFHKTTIIGEELSITIGSEFD